MLGAQPSPAAIPGMLPLTLGHTPLAGPGRSVPVGAGPISTSAPTQVGCAGLDQVGGVGEPALSGGPQPHATGPGRSSTANSGGWLAAPDHGNRAAPVDSELFPAGASVATSAAGLSSAQLVSSSGLSATHSVNHDELPLSELVGMSQSSAPSRTIAVAGEALGATSGSGGGGSTPGASSRRSNDGMLIEIDIDSEPLSSLPNHSPAPPCAETRRTAQSPVAGAPCGHEEMVCDIEASVWPVGVGETQAGESQAGEGDNAKAKLFPCQRCPGVMLLKQYAGVWCVRCSRLPACEHSVWLPNGVVAAEPSGHCEVCGPRLGGEVRRLTLQMAPGHASTLLPAGSDTLQGVCIAGCSDTLERLGAQGL
mmetsp:Transcript_27223/g.68229  ORF Transcript_27223/g.68229 Transcript_27223/m.68229 type:complete len:366 (-) Transcript_27223:30-1127(-)